MQLSTPGLRRIAALGMAISATLSMAGLVRADVADFIPDTALMVVKVNKLSQFNKDMGMLAREFGLAEMSPEAADPLAAFQAESGIKNGLNLEGDLAMYIANGEMEGEEPPMVVLIPVSDYAAFLTNFQDVQQQDGVDAGSINGEPAFFAHWGDYAAMSPMAELVKNKPGQTLKFAGVTGEEMKEQDAVLYANFKHLGPMLTEQLKGQDVKAQAKAEIMKDVEANPAGQKFAPVIDAAIDQAFMAAESFLRDADAASISLDLSEAGIGMGVIAQFKADSYLGNTFGKMKTADGSLLAGLPDGTYIAFGGSVADREMQTKLFNDLFGPIITKLQGVEGTEKMAEYIDAVKTQVTASSGATFGMFAPEGALGAGSLIQQVVIQEGDAREMMAAQRKAATLWPEIMASFAGGDAAAMGVSMNYQEGAKTVAGVTFDKITTNFGGEQAQGMDMPMKLMFGPEGPVSMVGTVDDKLLISSGLTDQQLEGVIAAVKGDKDVLSGARSVKMVSDQLPEKRTAVFYFAADELVRSALGYAQQMGMNVPVQLPEDLPPIGIAVGSAENALRMNYFVSKDLVSALIVAGIQAQQQMQGGGGGGGL